MIQRGEDLRFTLKSRKALRVSGKRFRQKLERDVAVKLRIARAIDLAHPTLADLGEDFVRAEAHARG